MLLAVHIQIYRHDGLPFLILSISPPILLHAGSLVKRLRMYADEVFDLTVGQHVVKGGINGPDSPG